MLEKPPSTNPHLFDRAVIKRPFTVSPTCSVDETIAGMHSHQTSYALVVEKKQADERLQREQTQTEVIPVGIFTERDIVRVVASGQSLNNQTAAAAASSELVTISAADITTPANVFTRMRQHGLRHLPVISDKGALTGIITQQSLREALNLPALLKVRTVSEVVISKIISAPQSATAISVAKIMAQHDTTCVIIIDDHTHPIGILTARDIVQFKALGTPLEQVYVQQVMSTPLLTIHPQDSLWTAHALMNRYRVRRLVVSHLDGTLAGLVTQSSILQASNPDNMQQVVELLQLELEQLRSENQRLLEVRNRDLQEKQAQLSQQLTATQSEQQQTASQLKVAYQDIAETNLALTASNEELTQTLQALRTIEQALQTSNAELEDTVAQRTAELRRAEHRWRKLLEEVHLAVVGLDAAGDVNYANPFFLTLTGYRASDVMGSNWFENFIPHNDRSHTRAYFKKLVTQGEVPLRYQNGVLTRTGAQHTLDWHNVVLRDQREQVTGTMSIGEDITERLVVNKVKGDFISVVSHELRTPVTAIHGALQMVCNGLVASDSIRGKELLQVASDNAKRLVRLVNDILELERLASNEGLIHKTTVNTRSLTSKAVKSVQVMAQEKQIAIQISDLEITLMADSDRLIQVLTNLLDNAIKFSPMDSTIDVVVNSPVIGDETSPSALFCVRDQGRGIPATELPRIFERFTQVNHSDARAMRGTGLGLAICKNIVEQHGGTIWAESTLGKGSQFFFTIPYESQSSRRAVE